MVLLGADVGRGLGLCDGLGEEGRVRGEGEEGEVAEGTEVREDEGAVCAEGGGGAGGGGKEVGDDCFLVVEAAEGVRDDRRAERLLWRGVGGVSARAFLKEVKGWDVLLRVGSRTRAVCLWTACLPSGLPSWSLRGRLASESILRHFPLQQLGSATPGTARGRPLTRTGKVQRGRSRVAGERESAGIFRAARPSLDLAS